MTDEDLALTVATNRGPGIEPWPIWAVAAHTAGARVYWLCHVLGEPGAETTPFADPSGFGWEDDLATVRSRDEVVAAYESTWPILAGALARWTPDVRAEPVRIEGRRGTVVHTREGLLMRLLTHEAYHAGEISLTLSAHDREPVDLWPAADWLEARAG
jgi:uncharacterized damage-inducible protein DinB